ncbi:MAG TPA: F0F1 ATP synthase subunit B [Lentisphaeria bacterium]|nr:MAG: hypothetical protein A2X47_03335 [Lentisphaerae bacterium GWF2_38_69]HBM15284.1 F0F1 ATP synthase subunit B [Lentisphaeria bacterium]
MLIDAFTVVAQIINFMILLWFLRRYLYIPILKVIDEREKRIADQLKSAHDEKEKSILERRELERKNTELDKQRSNLMKTAASDAQSLRQKLLEDARKESESLKIKLWNSIQNEYLTLKKDIYSRTQQEVFSIARKTLSDLADSSLEESITRTFLRRLSSIDKKQKELLLSAIKASGNNTILIRSTFGIASEQREIIEASLREITGDIQYKIVFQDSDSRIFGIEFVTSDYKIEWNISDYISSMEKTMTETLAEKIKVKTTEGIIQ